MVRVRLVARRCASNEYDPSGIAPATKGKETSASASPGTGGGPENGGGAGWAFVLEPMAMNVPQLTQNMRLGVLGVSQLQQSTVRDGTTGT
jgi:hypothetical protein